jgi:dipeptidyl-peptidase-3
MNYEMLPNEGFEAIRNFLIKLHCFKATGDIERGTDLFNFYTYIDETTIQIRDIVVARQKPRKINVQPTIRLSAQTGDVELLEYDETFDGVIRSF